MKEKNKTTYNLTDAELKAFMKQERLYFLIVSVCALLTMAAGIVWKYVPSLHFLLPAQCPFVMYFHIYCPGCGGTRAVFSMMEGHLLQSLFSNPVVLYITVLFLEYYIGAIITLIKKNGRRYYWLTEWHGYGAVILISLFTVIRNVLLISAHYDYLGDCVSYWIHH